jgi:hypothetical protein
VSQLLQATMIQEERIILGGNTSVALGTTPTPTVTPSNAGGSLAASTTHSVICVALGLQAYLDLAGANNGATNQSFAAATAAIAGQITRTNADGTTDTFGDGSAQKSAASAAATTTGSAIGSLACTVTAVNGAVGYAWYYGATAGAERLNQLTTINSASSPRPPAAARSSRRIAGCQRQLDEHA